MKQTMYTFIISDYEGQTLWSKTVTFPTANDYTEATDKKEELKRELKTNEIFLEHGEM